MSLKRPSRVYTAPTTDGQPSRFVECGVADAETRAQRVGRECRGAVAGEHLLPVLLRGAVDTDECPVHPDRARGVPEAHRGGRRGADTEREHPGERRP